jgi:hypothetical protein
MSLRCGARRGKIGVAMDLRARKARALRRWAIFSGIPPIVGVALWFAASSDKLPFPDGASLVIGAFSFFALLPGEFLSDIIYDKFPKLSVNYAPLINGVLTWAVYFALAYICIIVYFKHEQISDPDLSNQP